MFLLCILLLFLKVEKPYLKQKVNLIELVVKEGIFLGWQGCSSGFPAEQPCQPSENPVHPFSFTWINPFLGRVMSCIENLCTHQDYKATKLHCSKKVCHKMEFANGQVSLLVNHLTSKAFLNNPENKKTLKKILFKFFKKDSHFYAKHKT